MSGVIQSIPLSIVLAVELPAGRKLEMVECSDGGVAITVDGAGTPEWRWPMERLEDCVVVFLALVKSQHDVC